MQPREVPVLQHDANIAFESLIKSWFFGRQAEQSSRLPIALRGNFDRSVKKGRRAIPAR
jgi:hypothetical protein